MSYLHQIFFKRPNFTCRTIPLNRLLIALAFFFIIFYNFTFFRHDIEVYPLSLKNIPFLFSQIIVFACFLIMLFSLFSFKYIIKPFLIINLIISSFISYFMDSYNIFIDDTMIQNAINSNMAESTELISLKMIIYFIFLGLIPSFIIYRLKIDYKRVVREFLSRLKLFGISLLIMIAVMLLFGRFYASFLREHKPLRYYTNPSYYIYSFIKYVNGYVFAENMKLSEIGLDAKPAFKDPKRKLLILIVGETARADRFSLNGYHRETNPLLSKEKIINFPDFWSCGTTTSISVPCMFSNYTRSNYDHEKVKYTENLLDVLTHAGINVLWLENNTGSRGVADRVKEIACQKKENNSVCDIECRDEGMIYNISDYIDSHSGDIVIIMHQMGNHGPAYYKRYPKRFERFKPVCQTNQLEECSKEEIDNAYDNAILYTDYFLSEVIGFLKSNYTDFESAMIYLSDHGESLGEKGLYLHGIPAFMAPKTQLHVPLILWFNENFRIDRKSLLEKSIKEYSQDNLFHSVLGLMNVKTSLYDEEMDIFHSLITKKENY